MAIKSVEFAIKAALGFECNGSEVVSANNKSVITKIYKWILTAFGNLVVYQDSPPPRNNPTTTTTHI